MYRFYSPGTTIFAILVMCILSLFPRRKKLRVSKTCNEPSDTERANISAMKKVVAEHEGFTAEVIPINVFGRKRVETFRLISPGHSVELRMKDGDIKVFLFGEYIAELLLPTDSHLQQILAESIPFDAYLGGRDLAFMYDDAYDSCSIIVFYKLKGVPPTKVNLS